jgi:hypothetical protein
MNSTVRTGKRIDVSRSQFDWIAETPSYAIVPAGDTSPAPPIDPDPIKTSCTGSRLRPPAGLVPDTRHCPPIRNFATARFKP